MDINWTSLRARLDASIKPANKRRRANMRRRFRGLMHSNNGAPTVKEELIASGGASCLFGHDSTIDELETHHILPIWCGGNNDKDNLALVCKDHHAHIHKTLKI